MVSNLSLYNLTKRCVCLIGASLYLSLSAQSYVPFGQFEGQQAGCIYGDFLFRFRKDNTFNVYRLSSQALIGNYDLDKELAPHCNIACFGAEKYNKRDAFPLLYTNAYNNTDLPKGTCYVYRLQSNSALGFTTTLVQTITIGFTSDSLWTNGLEDIRPYGNFVVDTDRRCLYVYTLRDKDQTTRFFRFRLPQRKEGEIITLTKEDILDCWDCPYFPFIQDNCYHKGKLYLCTGFGTDKHPGFIRIVDVKKHKVIRTISLNDIQLTEEPEYIDFLGKNLIYGAGKRDVYRFTTF